MLRSVSIVPAILTSSKTDFRIQVERLNPFTKRAQIDLTDGQFATAETIDESVVWWPKGWAADLHFMVARPSEHLNTILRLTPSLCIFHAEVEEDLLPTFQALKARGIRTGVALLPTSYPGDYKHYIDVVDHVLIFATQLGIQGSPADMMQMEKIPLIRAIKAEVEIGWDGGANLETVRALAHADLDVINVGAALSQSPNPAETYQQLLAEVDKNGVVL